MDWTTKTPKFSDIIRTKVSFYYHYGIFVNEQEVIQFGLPDDPSRPACDVFVISTTIDEFLKCGGEIEVGIANNEEHKKMRPPNEIVKIARSKIGEGGYDLLHNNCEHFVNNCAFGESRSNFLNSIRASIKEKLNKKD